MKIFIFQIGYQNIQKTLYEPNYKETEEIIREIQKHPVAFKNVATLMEVMNYLTDVSALQAAGADYSGITGKDSPTPQENFKFVLTSFYRGLFSFTYSDLFNFDIKIFHRTQ